MHSFVWSPGRRAVLLPLLIAAILFGCVTMEFAQVEVLHSTDPFRLDLDFALPHELRVTLTTDKPEYRPLETIAFRVTVTNIASRIIKTRMPSQSYVTTCIDSRKLDDDEVADVPKSPIEQGHGGSSEIISLKPGESLSTDFAESHGSWYPTIENAYVPGRYAVRVVYTTGNYDMAMKDPPATPAYSEVVEYRIRSHTAEEQAEYEEYLVARNDNSAVLRRGEEIQLMEDYLQKHPRSFYRVQGLNRLSTLYFQEKRTDDLIKACRMLRRESLPSENNDSLLFEEIEVYDEQKDYERAYRVLEQSGRKGFQVRWRMNSLERSHGPFPPASVAEIRPSVERTTDQTTVSTTNPVGTGLLTRNTFLVCGIAAGIVFVVRNRLRHRSQR